MPSRPLLTRPLIDCHSRAQLAWRYSALYFYERSYESGGSLFPLLFDLMVGGRPASRWAGGRRRHAPASCLALPARGQQPRLHHDRPSSAPPPFLHCQIYTMSLTSIFTSLVLASKKMWIASVILLATQPAAIWVFHT